MREKRLRWKAGQRASERRGRIRADLESKGIAPEFSEPVANHLVDIAPDFASAEYGAVLDGVAAAYGVHRRECGAADDVKEIRRLMLHFATIAGDADEIKYWSVASERRALHLLTMTMRNAGVGQAYAEGVARKMKLRLPLVDMPAKHILKINTAIYLHWKRKQKKESRV